jgi:cell division protein FtsI/penicillin-binding protein 2
MDKELAGGPTSVVSTWTAGIGQGPVQATPLQMANVAATLARGGVWVRPRLLTGKTVAAYGPATRPSEGPERVDLQLPPDALRAVKEGMVRVVNGPAGSGGAAKRDDMLVAGKTGSATAAPVYVPVIDPVTKRPVLDERKLPKKQARLERLRPSSHWNPNPEAPWYRDTGPENAQHPTLTHSWFMGYAPADNPQIAFAVLVEYGGGGGSAAGSIAKEMIQVCINHGHLKLPVASAAPATVPAVGGPVAGAELLHDVSR